MLDSQALLATPANRWPVAISTLPCALVFRTGSLTTSAARLVAHKLLAREGSDTGPASNAAVNVDAVRRACWRMSVNLQRSLGDEGRDALIARAVRRTETNHPVLSHLRPLDGTGISPEAIDASIATHGGPAVAHAIESLIAAVVDILSSLIGSDMALTLLEYDGPRPSITRTRQSP